MDIVPSYTITKKVKQHSSLNTVSEDDHFANNNKQIKIYLFKLFENRGVILFVHNNKLANDSLSTKS